MKRFLILLILPILACNGLSTPPPSTSETASPTSTGIALTQPSPPTEPTPNASTFPNPDAYEWQLVAERLDRPVDLQPDPFWSFVGRGKIGTYPSHPK
jgi:hypothetical protein